MKKYAFLAAGILILSLSGCVVLSDSQIKNVNAFSSVAANYTNYPSEILKKRAELHLQNELIVLLTLSNFDRMDAQVDKIRANYDNAIASSAKFDLSLQILRQYTNLLVELSSDKYTKDLSGAASGMGTNLTSLVSAWNARGKDSIPADLSSEIANALLSIGRRLTKNKQAKALQKFIPLGNVLVKKTIQNIVEVLDGDSIPGRDGKMGPGLKKLLAREKNDAIQNYKNILFTGATSNYDSLRQYYDLKVDYDNTESLRQKCIASANQLAAAHDVLAKSVVVKQDLKGIIQETQDLATDFQDLGKIAGHWTSNIKL